MYSISSFIVVEMLCMFYVFFFFQAEDGIRDLVRSRGLGDVYKRQLYTSCTKDNPTGEELGVASCEGCHTNYAHLQAVYSVSYTHLTLPTSDLV